MERGFVVVDADLSPERRLVGSGVATYRELMQNISTKSRPDGGGSAPILDGLMVSRTKSPKIPECVQTTMVLMTKWNREFWQQLRIQKA